MSEHIGIAVPISVAARQCGLTIRATRFYEEQKLVESTRAASGTRYFDRAAIQRLLFIASARRAGIGIRDIRSLLYARDRDDRTSAAKKLREVCEAHLREIGRRRQHLELMVSGFCQSPD